MLEAVEPLALEDGMAVITCEVEVAGAVEEPTEATGGGAQPGLTPTHVVHQMWEAP